MLSKSMMMFASVKPLAVADTTDDICVVTFAISDTVPLMPEDCTVPVLTSVEAPVLITVIWLSSVDAAVEITVSWLASELTPVERTVARDLTELMPAFAVESEPLTWSQRLFSVDTCADVEPVVAFDCAVLRRVARLVTAEVRVDRLVALESRLDWTVDSELSTLSAVEVPAEADRLLDCVVDSRTDTLVSAETLADTEDDTDTSPESAADTERFSVEAAVLVTLAEFNALTSVDVWVDATVRRLVCVDTPDDTLVSNERLDEIPDCSAATCSAAVDAPAETAFVKLMPVEMPVFSAVTWLSTDDVPVVVVDRLVDRLVKALRPEDTCALVGEAPSATIVEIAVEKRVASDTVPEKLVLFRVAPLRAVDAGADTDVAAESAWLATPDRDVCVESAVLTDVERTLSLESAEDASVVWEVAPTATVESVVESEVSAEAAVDTDPVGEVAPGSTAFRTLVVGNALASRTAVPNVPASTIRVIRHS